MRLEYHVPIYDGVITNIAGNIMYLSNHKVSHFVHQYSYSSGQKKGKYEFCDNPAYHWCVIIVGGEILAREGQVGFHCVEVFTAS